MAGQSWPCRLSSQETVVPYPVHDCINVLSTIYLLRLETAQRFPRIHHSKSRKVVNIILN